MSEPVAYVVTLMPAPDRNGIHDLRALLKIAKRHFHLRALDVREHQTVRRHDAKRQIVKAEGVATVTKEGIMPSARKFGFKNRWIKLEDLHDRPPLRECIGLAEPEDGKYGERLVLTFEPCGKMLSLNATSVEALIEGFGEEDYEKWSGRFVEVYAGETPGKDGMVDAVLGRAAEAPADAAVAARTVKTAMASAVKAAKASDMDDTIPF
jgi:hypothetical protein